MPGDQTFRVEYTYGPYVGRRYIIGPTFNAAVDAMWRDLADTMWVVKRFRVAKELEP